MRESESYYKIIKYLKKDDRLLMKILLPLLLLILPHVYSEEKFVDGMPIEEREVIDDILLFSGKNNGVRFFKGKVSKELDLPFSSVVAAVREFEKRCSNELKDKRNHLAPDYICEMENENVVESIKFTELKYSKNDPFKTDQYILQRKVYNHGEYHYYDLITEKQIELENTKVVIIIQSLLSDKDAKQYLGEKAEPRESVFNNTEGIFTLKDLGSNKTLFTYEYTTKTEHWVLNKSFMVSRFFEGTSKSLNNLVKEISKRATIIEEEKAKEKKLKLTQFR